MGCNIPWANVNGTTIVDVGVVRNFATLNYKECDLFLTLKCYHVLCGFKHNNVKIVDKLKCKIIDKQKPFFSSGHMAALELIKMGSTTIDIYGCDSYFDDVIDSFTWRYVPSYANDKHKAKQLIEWRKNWASIKDEFNVEMNFIKA